MNSNANIAYLQNMFTKRINSNDTDQDYGHEFGSKDDYNFKQSPNFTSILNKIAVAGSSG